MRKELSHQEEIAFYYWRLGGEVEAARRLVVDLWANYVAGVKETCKTEGIEFVDLNLMDLDGWCFIDDVHMTDNGYMQVARKIAEVMDSPD
jgi:hypothetical protein